MPTLAGLMPVRTGVGFRIETLLEPLMEASATLVARTVTELGFGRVAGAVYLPFESMMPSAAEPLVAPLTDHWTAAFVVPDTAAEKERESPARMFAVEGETLRVMAGGGG